MLFRSGLLLMAFPAFAQNPVTSEPASATEIESLLGTLKDDAKREAFVADLEAMVAAQRGLKDRKSGV